ncbi:MAG: M20/M25/M40 family metallo-hydrolase [Clostridia bacterium]|nr:M20/M25/M40 family metallo-hydrolase [Clostridia bacterium]
MDFNFFDKDGLSLLESLCNSFGVSGYEHETAQIIIEKITPYCDSVMVDSVGNVIALKKGKGQGNKKIMLCAHMDEVGFAIKSINEDGTLQIDGVGMVSTVLPSKRVVVGKNRIKGVISARPVHLNTDKTKACEISDLVIDVGAKDKQQAQALDLLGEGACFESEFYTFGDGLVKAKALDDRIGCAILCMLTKESFDSDIYFAFTVGEELGGVGAAAATRRINPDFCIVVEGTTASDFDGAKEQDKVCSIRNGAVCPFMDGGTLYDKDLYTCIHEYANDNGIKIQVKTKIAGGTDAAKIQRSLEGIKTAVISLPCRYIHSSSSVAAIEDMQSMYKLISGVCKKLK